VGGLGGVRDLGLSRSPRTFTRPAYPQTDQELPSQLIEWFGARGISRPVVERNKITLGRKYLPGLGQEVAVIQFPYFRGGVLINVKYRAISEKAFVQESGAEKIPFGVDDIVEVEVIFVEGELDKLALEEAGMRNGLSVPDGAPPAGSKPSDTKFDYLRNCETELSGLKKIILAVDNDGPGKTLEAELARRLGPERCWRVEWPDGCKDANDVLMKHGPETLKACIDNATRWPIDGVVEPRDLIDEVFRLYESGLRGGVGTGWPVVDSHYRVAPGELSILTGIPGHGKSEWLDALISNLANEHGWFVGVASFENWPLEKHFSKLLEKKIGKPFGEGPTPRMTHEDLVNGLQWLQDHFVFFSPPEEAMTLDAILDLARVAVLRYGIRGLVLDPWNEIDHARPSNLTETEYISQSLSKVRRFARNHGVHVWIVAHPLKLRRREDGSYPVPTPYDISGSAHWRNKADNCLTVYREEMSEEDSEEKYVVQLHIQKIRFKQNGKIGAVELKWNPINGRYASIEEQDARA
jgi:twinkle protein